jgi:hypothetical protein
MRAGPGRSGFRWSGTQSDLLRRQRVILLVEGLHDQIVLEGLLGDELRRSRVHMVPIRGGRQLPAALESQLLFDFTDALIVPVLDNLSAEHVNDVWRAPRGWLTAPIPPARRSTFWIRCLASPHPKASNFASSWSKRSRWDWSLGCNRARSAGRTSWSISRWTPLSMASPVGRTCGEPTRERFEGGVQGLGGCGLPHRLRRVSYHVRRIFHGLNPPRVHRLAGCLSIRHASVTS